MAEQEPPQDIADAPAAVAAEPETRHLNVGSPSILPIVPGDGNKLPEIGSPS